MSISCNPEMWLLFSAINILQISNELSPDGQTRYFLDQTSSSRGQNSVSTDQNCSDLKGTPQDGSRESAKILPHHITLQALCIGVQSNGCTNHDSFSVSVNREGSTTRIILTRLEPDLCRMKSH